MSEVYEKEDLILKNLIKHTEEYSRKVIHFLQKDYFQKPEHKAILQAIQEHFDKYNEIPTKDALIIDLEDGNNKLNDDEFQEAVKLVQSYDASEAEQDVNWLEDTTEKFCKDKAVYNTLLQAIQLVDDTENTDKNIKDLNEHAIPQMFEEALSISFHSDIGIVYTESFEDQWQFYHQKLNKIPFQMDVMNKITNGGGNRKALCALLGSTGVGKTRFKTHQAAQYAMMGYNVVYFTMEMAREEIRKLADAALMSVDVDDLDKIPYDNYMKKAEKVKEKVNGQIFIEEYPNGFPHAGHFRYYLKELQSKRGIKPDVIIIDYVNICASSRYKKADANSYNIVKSISEEMRGLGQEWDALVWTSTQLNRGGAQSGDPELTDISESWGLAHTADFVLGALADEHLEKMDPPQIMMKQLKNRFGDLNYYKKFNLGIDKGKSQYFEIGNTGYEPDDSHMEDPTEQISVGQEKKALNNNKPKKSLRV